MIITKQHFNDLHQTILNKDNTIKLLLKKIDRLEKAANPENVRGLDFPNSNRKGAFGDSVTPINLTDRYFK